MTLDEIAAAVDGRVRGDGRARVERVVVDSRGVRPGDLFVALPGDHADGSRFVSAALRDGASGAIVRTDTAGDASGVIEVADPGRALMALAGHHRARLTARVVGITGSTGKTCTKDFAAAILRQRFDVVASPASFNNEIGLPLTLLTATAATGVVVCEMGSRGPGHIRALCDVARPEVGVVTNVGVAHMGLFGTPEALRDAKAELPEALPEAGTAVLNGDDPAVRSYAERTPARVVLFGQSSGAQVRAEGVELDPMSGRARFELRAPDGSPATVVLPVPGAHMVSNALAAAATGWALGLTAAECAEGLRTAEVAGGRMEVVDTPAGIRVIDDAYNANPASMAAALRAARSMAGQARTIAVLGHMAELGSISAFEHERIGELLARLGIDELVVVGEEARMISVGAEREGVEPHRIHRVAGPEEAAEVVRMLAAPGDLVLVKASRVERLERVVDALRAGSGAQVRA